MELRPHLWKAGEAGGTLVSSEWLNEMDDAIQRNALRTANAVPLRRFRTALADRDANAVDVLTIGHSFMEGVYATSINKRMPNELLANLRSRFQPEGIVGGVGYVPSLWGVEHFTDDPVGTAGSPTPTDSWGLGRRSRLLRLAGDKVVITAEMTGCDIIYGAGPQSGTFNWNVDLGPATSVPTVNPSSNVDGNRAQIRGLDGASHQVWANQEAGIVAIDGFMVYNGDETKGIRLWDGARSSKDTSWFAAPSPLNFWYGNVGTIQPDLVIITIVRNDWANGIPSTTTLTNLKSIIEGIRYKSTIDPSIVLCLEPDPTGIGPGASIEPWENYVAAAYQFAIEDPEVALFDLGATLGPVGSSALWHSDDIHPSNIGHKMWSDQLAEFLAAG